MTVGLDPERAVVARWAVDDHVLERDPLTVQNLDPVLMDPIDPTPTGDLAGNREVVGPAPDLEAIPNAVEDVNVDGPRAVLPQIADPGPSELAPDRLRRVIVVDLDLGMILEAITDPGLVHQANGV